MDKGKRDQFWFDLEWVDESKKTDHDDLVQAFIGKLSQAISALGCTSDWASLSTVGGSAPVR
jgi:hypothetical protein